MEPSSMKLHAGSVPGDPAVTVRRDAIGTRRDGPHCCLKVEGLLSYNWSFRKGLLYAE